MRFILIALSFFLAGTAASEYREDPLPVEQREVDPVDAFPAAISGSAGGAVIDNAHEKSSTSAAGEQWEQYKQIQNLLQQLQELRGLLEEQTYGLEQIRKQQRERYLDLDNRINRLAAGGTEASAGGTVAADTSVKTLGDDKKTYTKAKGLMKDRKYNEAVEVLTVLLEKSPDSVYAPYSNYWLGELYMALSPPELVQAEANFNILLSKFPKHKKVPDVLYKLGKLYYQKGNAGAAKTSLNRLIDEHPASQAAGLARKYMQTIQ